MFKHPTKLLLAGVAALALFALGTTSILAPAWAAGKPDKTTLGNFSCPFANLYIQWNGLEWVCADGADDPKGDTGDTGADGPKGDTGDQGPIGLTGLTGAAGSQGPIGLTGADGDEGQIGLTGADGDVGPIGPIGPQGEPGSGDVTDIQIQLDNLALLAFGQASAFAFVTSVTYTGDLGGTLGANIKCNDRAFVAGLPGQYKA